MVRMNQIVDGSVPADVQNSQYVPASVLFSRICKYIYSINTLKDEPNAK